MTFSINNFDFDDINSSFFIAEIGNNHNGKIEDALKMIDMAKDAGADCVKFQMRNMDSLYRKKSLKKDGDDLGSEYIIDLLKRFELSLDEHKKLFEYCKKINITYMCTPWDKPSIKILEGFGVDAYKVASADLTNLPLLDELIATKKPLILSTGMSEFDEIVNSVTYLKNKNAKFCLLHCNSTYPAPIEDINLAWIGKLISLHPFIGYSGHERGISISLAARAMGARIIERHFTLDRNMEGPDHAASLEYNDLKNLINGIKEINKSIGNVKGVKLSQGQMINKENLSKSLMAARNIKKGQQITSGLVKVASPGQGLSPQRFNDLIGKYAIRNIEEEDFFYQSDIDGHRAAPKDYKFLHPWGLPVRYHDFQYYNEKVKPDLFEFHLSYSDLDLNPDKYLEKYENNFVVHAPELFINSHLMDLASPDESYRKISLKETQRVINMTRNLKRHFPSTDNPLIVANIGGISMDNLIPKKELDDYYNRFGDSLLELDTEGVEIIPQTMAPFPWHFGGQRYQNLFVHPDEIVEWCKKFNLRMCFDVSHSMLACNHFNYDFYEFATKIAPITAHLHIGDALGVNGEGLQVGDGEIDFVKLSEILNELCPKSSFIPEIWQGHKNGGEGFWVALDRLNNLL